jgi:hypothetical protein
MNGKQFKVIGVVEDFHQEDVHNPIGPFVMELHNKELDR